MAVVVHRADRAAWMADLLAERAESGDVVLHPVVQRPVHAPPEAFVDIAVLPAVVLDHAAAHRLAWAEVVAAGRPGLISDASCFPLVPEVIGSGLAALVQPGSLDAAVADALDAGDGVMAGDTNAEHGDVEDEDLVVLGGGGVSWAYVVGPAAARRLSALPPWVPLAEILDDVPTVSPPVVQPGPEPHGALVGIAPLDDDAVPVVDDQALLAATLDGTLCVADAADPDLVRVDGRWHHRGIHAPVHALVGPGAAALRPGSPTSGSPAPEVGALARLVRYDGAVDPRTTLRRLHDDIVVVPFWTPAFCAALIDAVEAANAWGRDPQDPVPGHEVSLPLVSPRLYAHVEAHWRTRVWPLLQQVWPMIDFVGFRDAFVIAYSPQASPELRLHQDVGQVSASVKLNDGYVGGRLHFPRQGVGNDDVAVGELVAWPSLVTHPHRSTPVTAGVKYGLTIWCEIPDVDRPYGS